LEGEVIIRIAAVQMIEDADYAAVGTSNADHAAKILGLSCFRCGLKPISKKAGARPDDAGRASSYSTGFQITAKTFSSS
jgi:hypothetical protein